MAGSINSQHQNMVLRRCKLRPEFVFAVPIKFLQSCALTDKAAGAATLLWDVPRRPKPPQDRKLSLLRRAVCLISGCVEVRRAVPLREGKVIDGYVGVHGLRFLKGIQPCCAGLRGIVLQKRFKIGNLAGHDALQNFRGGRSGGHKQVKGDGRVLVEQNGFRND